MGWRTWIGRGVTTVATAFVGNVIGAVISIGLHLGGLTSVAVTWLPTVAGLGVGYWVSTKLFKGAKAPSHGEEKVLGEHAVRKLKDDLKGFEDKSPTERQDIVRGLCAMHGVPKEIKQEILEKLGFDVSGAKAMLIEHVRNKKHVGKG